MYLGAKLWQTTLINGVLAWVMSSLKYVYEAANNCAKHVKDNPPGKYTLSDRAENSFVMGYETVMDMTKEFPAREGNVFLSGNLSLTCFSKFLAASRIYFEGLIPQSTTPFLNVIHQSLAPRYMSGSPVYPGFNLKYLSRLFKTAMQ